MKRLILVFFVSIFMTACFRGHAPAGVIERGKMISLLTDIHLIDSYMSGSGQYDTTAQPVSNYHKVVYKKFQTDSAQFQKSLRYYSLKPKLLDTMYHQVLQNLEKMERIENFKEQQKNKAKEAQEVQKKNAEIRLKPQPNWFFKYDTTGLFNRQFNNQALIPTE